MRQYESRKLTRDIYSVIDVYRKPIEFKLFLKVKATRLRPDGIFTVHLDDATSASREL